MTASTLLRIKDYAILFECSEMTAKRLIRQDRRKLDKFHITTTDVANLWGLNVADIIEDLGGNVSKCIKTAQKGSK